MNVLGVTFDSKLIGRFIMQIAFLKQKSPLCTQTSEAFLQTPQMRTLHDANFYSILYYNSSIWMSPDLSYACKHDLLAVSALALKSCLGSFQNDISFINVHKNHNKCTPNQIMLYQNAINLHKTINESLQVLSTEQLRLFEQMICTRRQIIFELFRTNKSKIGINSNENNFYHINKLIVMEKLNWSIPLFKKHMKMQFLTFENT